MSFNTTFLHETRPEVLKALINRFMTENVLQEAHIWVVRAFQLIEEGKLEFETDFLRLQESVLKFLQQWRKLATTFVTWNDLVARRSWKNYDGCLKMIVLVALTLEIFLLQKDASNTYQQNLYRPDSQRVLELKKDYLHWYSTKPWMHHFLDVVYLSNKVRSLNCILWTKWKSFTN